MNKRNYAKELNRIIEKNGSEKPTVLLHCCCGPCATSVLEYLSQYFKVTVFWYNPNIYPENEFVKRFNTLLEVIEKLDLSDQVDIIYQPWRHDEYSECAAGFENEKEGGARCRQCFMLRLFETAKTAKEKGFNYFCSTLTVSRHKNAELINNIGEKLAEEYNVLWLPSDFKKDNGENRSVELSEKFKIYRQLYCGCEFSLDERNKPKLVQ